MGFKLTTFWSWANHYAILPRILAYPSFDLEGQVDIAQDLRLTDPHANFIFFQIQDYTTEFGPGGIRQLI